MPYVVKNYEGGEEFLSDETYEIIVEEGPGRYQVGTLLKLTTGNLNGGRYSGMGEHHNPEYKTYALVTRAAYGEASYLGFKNVNVRRASERLENFTNLLLSPLYRR